MCSGITLLSEKYVHLPECRFLAAPSQPAAHFVSSKCDHHVCCSDVRAQVKPVKVCALVYNNTLRARGGRCDKVIISQFFYQKNPDHDFITVFYIDLLLFFFVLFCFTILEVSEQCNLSISLCEMIALKEN